MENVELRASLKKADMDLDLVLDAGECVWCILTVTDTQSEEMVTFTVSLEQAGAIWFLAIAGDSDKLGDKLVRRLYKLAEPAVDGLVRNLRPIP